MTNGPDPLDTAIDEVAHAMTSHGAPDLRARVAASLGHAASGFAWWQPAAAAAVVVAALVAWWPTPAPSPMPGPAPAAHVDSPVVPIPVPSGAAHAGDTTARTRGRRAQRGAASEPWPALDETIEPLAVTALALDPIEPSIDEPLAPIDVSPLSLRPLEVEPLAESDSERRRR